MMKVDKDDNIEVIVNNTDPVTGNQTQTRVKTRSNIFQPITSKEGRFRVWLRDMFQFLETMTYNNHRRFWVMHFVFKKYFMYPIFKVLVKVLGKNLVKEDIEIAQYPYNNHIRLLRESLHEATDDVWRYMVYPQNVMGAKNRGVDPDFTSSEHILKYVKSKTYLSCYKARFLAWNIWITEMLEDSIDRELCNFLVMRIAHEMMMFYGVSETERAKIPIPGQYPIYLANGPHHPDYFAEMAKYPVWLTTKQRLAKIKQQNEKDNGKEKEELKENGKHISKGKRKE